MGIRASCAFVSRAILLQKENMVLNHPILRQGGEH